MRQLSARPLCLLSCAIEETSSTYAPLTMVPELTVTRLELSDLQDALQWSPEGTLVINSMAELTFLTPKYTKEHIKTAGSLYERKTLAVQALPKSKFFQSQMPYERTSTFLTSAEDYAVALKWSPLFNHISYLAVLTSQLSVALVKDCELHSDLTPTQIFSSQEELDQHRVHSLEWLVAKDQLLLLLGVHSGHIRLLGAETGLEADLVKVCDSPIIMLKVFANVIFAVSARNEIFKVEGSNVQIIKAADRSLIYDLYPKEGLVYYTTCGKLTKLEFIRRISPITVKTGLLTHAKIVPEGDNLLLLSESKSVKLNESLSVVSDDVVAPIMLKSLQSWTRKYNDFNTQKVSLHKFGSSWNYDGNLLAIIYDLQQDASYKYIIASERVYKVAFIPLNNNFNDKGSPLSYYHEFKLTGHLTDIATEDATVNYKVDFPTYLKEGVYGNPELIQLAAKNLIFTDKDALIRKKYATLVVSYIANKKLEVTNTIDKAVLASLEFIAGHAVTEEVKNVTIHAGPISEVFDFGPEQDTDTVVSHTDHVWQRCCLTFLPILTPFVKYDATTEKRALDISRDSANDFGPITRALLESSEFCVYSGCRFKGK